MECGPPFALLSLALHMLRAGLKERLAKLQPTFFCGGEMEGGL